MKYFNLTDHLYSQAIARIPSIYFNANEIDFFVKYMDVANDY